MHAWRGGSGSSACRKWHSRTWCREWHMGDHIPRPMTLVACQVFSGCVKEIHRNMVIQLILQWPIFSYFWTRSARKYYFRKHNLGCLAEHGATMQTSMHGLRCSTNVQRRTPHLQQMQRFVNGVGGMTQTLGDIFSILTKMGSYATPITEGSLLSNRNLTTSQL